MGIPDFQKLNKWEDTHYITFKFKFKTSPRVELIFGHCACN